MVSTYQLKRSFQQLLRPISNQLLKLGVTPNQVTAFTILLSIFFSIFIGELSHTSEIFFLVPVFLLLRMALNAIDGLMAKEGNLMTPLGVFLNELGDVVSDVSLFFAFCSLSFIRLEPMIVFAIFAIISEMAGVVAVQTGAPRSYDGPMGKSDRAVLLVIISGMIIGGATSPVYYDGALIVGITGLVVTIFNRIKNSITNSKQI